MAGKIRLPAGVQPVNYNLFFDIDLEKFVFSGKETVDLKISKPTKNIILHSSGLKIKNASALFKKKTIKAKISENKKLEQLTLSFGEKISSEASIMIEFEGKLTDDLAGLYRSKYTVGKTEKYMATTQFEAPYARRAFPCFDEPALKATFDVTLKIDKKLQAISNMPVKKELTERGKKTVKFQRTPIMSTYLLYLGVGEFEFLESKLGKVLIRIVTMPGKKDQAGFALELTKKFLDYFQKYSGVPYPLPKLDMIAIPDFAAAAMENWGAIACRELALLFDKEKTSLSAKKRIAEVIAHELWHQWSGDLVTMKWWNDLWLNESFATYMAYKAIDHYFPEWKVWEDFVLDETDVAFDADSVMATHPIEVNVSDPHQLEEIFDSISYNKGGSVLRMIENYMGEENFRKGVSKYLMENKYSNATAEDLWKCLESASHKPVRKIAATWIKQPGFPLVTAGVKGNRLYLSQKRFVFNSKANAAWPVPLTVKTNDRILTDLMKSANKEIILKDHLVKINYGQMGFYRVRYDENTLSNLKTLVAGKKLPVVDRWGLHSDLFRLCRHGEITIDKYLDFIKSYRNEDSFLALSGIYGSMQSVHYVFSQENFWERIWPDFSGMFHDTFASVLNRLGWIPKANEPNKDTLLRNMAIKYMGFIEHAETKRAALEKLEEYIKGKPLHPDVRSAVFFVAAAGSKSAYPDLLHIYNRSDNPEEKRQVLAAIGSFKDTATIKKALDFSISKKVRIQDVYMTYAYAASNPAARNMLLNWTEKNWKQIEEYKKSHHMFITFLEFLITAYVTRDKEKELQKFFKRHPVEYKMTLDKSFDRMRRNAFWLEKNKKVLAEYFGA